MEILSVILFLVGITLVALIFKKAMSPDNLKKNMRSAAFVSLLLVVFGFFISMFIFYSALSLATVAFSSLLLLPYNMNVFHMRAKCASRKWSHIFHRHNELIKFYLYSFFGMAVAYAMLFALFPPDLSDHLFSSQMSATGLAGNFSNPEIFFEIISNNLVLVFVAFALSIFYGAGSLYILNYNASLLGMLYGNVFRILIWSVPSIWLVNPILYLPHTILEIIGYLLAAVAGGILSEINLSHINRRYLLDSITLLIISINIILMAGYIEVILPGMFG